MHNGYHRTLGISARATDLFLFAMSIAMLGSLHAIKFNHLRHHRHCLDEYDVEGSAASLRAWQALCYGPLFTWRLHSYALLHAPLKLRSWVMAELAANGVWLFLVTQVFGNPALLYHVAVMVCAHCLTAFFAVWTVHHDCDRSHFIARTIRNRTSAWLTFEMFYHVEHHLFPAVPTCHLPELAARLDGAAPELQAARVFGGHRFESQRQSSSDKNPTR
ncbi:MAG: fatty acid desaturase [Phycisphaerae bacterium]